MANVQKSSDRPVASLPPQGEGSVWHWLYAEAVDHLIPWNRRFFHQRMAFQAAGIGLAVVATGSWLLMASGEISSAVNIAWWTGWSVYEVLVRKCCKPWIKEGPWWGSKRRPAGWFDMIAYVATKNLLIGAALFLLLSKLGVLQPLA